MFVSVLHFPIKLEAPEGVIMAEYEHGPKSPNIYSNMDINTNLTASHLSGLAEEREKHSMRNKNCTIDDNDHLWT